MSEIKHIVFDIGQVLLHWDPEIPYLQLIPDAEERQWFLSEVCSPAWNREQDRGREWADAEDLLIKDYPGYENLIRAYRRNWLQMLSHRIEGSVELFKQIIDAGWDVTMLTNWHQDTYVEACEVHEFLALPRGVTVSGEVKLIKPDPSIYLLHQEKFELEASKILFFDDSPDNVKAARALGWQAELFSLPESLHDDLKRYSIL